MSGAAPVVANPKLGLCAGTVVLEILIRPHVLIWPPTMSCPAASTENDERVLERKLEKHGGAPS